MKKGGYYRYDEELVIPIIENTPFEEDLQVKIIIARFISIKNNKTNLSIFKLVYFIKCLFQQNLKVL